MVVEIGTSDFRTEAGVTNGLYVEPVKPYFDRLPPCQKENVAISNYSGEAYIYYLEPSVVEELGLPNWARGCNSIGRPHPTIEKLLINKFGEEGKKYITKSVVKVMRIKDLLTKHKIKKITCLKIDTEGHDAVILNDFLDTVSIKPNKIIFEANELSKQRDINNVVAKLKRGGYTITKMRTDIVAVL